MAWMRTFVSMLTVCAVGLSAGESYAAKGGDSGKDKPSAGKSADGSTAKQGTRKTVRSKEAKRREDAKKRAKQPKSGASEKGAKKTDARKVDAKPCERPVVEVRGPNGDEDTFALTRCDGKLADLAPERLGILMRAGGANAPKLSAKDWAKAKGKSQPADMKRADPELITRLQSAALHFAKKGERARIVIMSGYRPSSAGSYHASAKAIDFRIEGVKNEDLVAFCKTLEDTGCGYYPNSLFVHMDARPKGSGHVGWIDASGPGESPRYVDSWPPKNTEPTSDKREQKEEAPKPSKEESHSSEAHPDPDGLPALPPPDRKAKRTAR